MATTHTTPQQQRTFLSYRTVWRWHFYAGVFAVPFILWLATTGSIYLFKPQIESLIDRPYDSLYLNGQTATAEAQVKAALAAVPGSTLHYYELPRTTHSATRIIIGRGTQEMRVYINPQTLQILKIADEDTRFMRIIFHLHGELFMGDRGSYIVELAASWAIVLILTGTYLWWPRQTNTLAGILYLRLHQGKRIFWRDLHAVTGIWISALALFLIFTGLPWAKGWGSYLKTARNLTTRSTMKADWTIGRSDELAQRQALNYASTNHASMSTMSGMTAEEHTEHMHHAPSFSAISDYSSLATIIATVTPLNLAYPVLISPPQRPNGPWSAKSDAPNRPLRTTLTIDPHTGAILHRQNFDQRPLIDRMVGIGVAAHEGQLFGLANQLLGLATALGLILLSLSAIVMWWRRRPDGVLGAPIPLTRPRFSPALAALIIAIGIYLPMMGASLILVLLIERFVLRRIPATSRWLGLTAP